MAFKVAGLLGALLLEAACQLPWASSTCNTQIDWINFVQVGSTQYVAGLRDQTPIALTQSDLGPEYSKVKFKVSGNVCDPNYRIKNGDAGFLEPGTVIYQVAGHPPTEELAARFNGAIVIYQAMSRNNPTD